MTVYAILDSATAYRIVLRRGDVQSLDRQAYIIEIQPLSCKGLAPSLDVTLTHDSKDSCHKGGRTAWQRELVSYESSVAGLRETLLLRSARVQIIDTEMEGTLKNSRIRACLSCWIHNPQDPARPFVLIPTTSTTQLPNYCRIFNINHNENRIQCRLGPVAACGLGCSRSRSGTSRRHP